jgi:Avian adenovirus fibre, N-terminal
MASTQIRGTTQIQAGTIADAQVAAAAAIQTSKLADGPKFIKSDGTVAMTAPLNMGSQTIQSLADPVNPTDAATRQWVLASIGSGVVSSTTVTAASAGANLTLSGTQTVDGIALAAGNTILVKDQTTQSGNGIYTVATGAWTRMAAMDTWAEVPGMLVSVQEGTVNHDTVWLSTADPGGTLGTTPITFTQLPGPSDITAGAGLLRTGQVIDVVATDASMTINADNLGVKLDPARGITVVAAGIGVNIDSATMQISGNLVGVKAGLYQPAGTYFTTANFVTRETPGGLMNGANTTFTLANTPTVNTEEVFLNGLLQEPGAGNDYTISGATITMLAAPQSTDRLRVNYRK